jgi:hypothetical protein
MSGTGSATMPSSASTSSIVATWASSGVTTSTRAPAISRRRNAEISATGAERAPPVMLTSSPSRAANTSSPLPDSAARARAAVSMRSIISSSCEGS